MVHPAVLPHRLRRAAWRGGPVGGQFELSLPPHAMLPGMGTFYLTLAGIVVVVVGALYWLGRDIDPDDRNNPPFDVRRAGG